MFVCCFLFPFNLIASTLSLTIAISLSDHKKVSSRTKHNLQYGMCVLSASVCQSQSFTFFLISIFVICHRRPVAFCMTLVWRWILNTQNSCNYAQPWHSNAYTRTTEQSGPLFALYAVVQITEKGMEIVARLERVDDDGVLCAAAASEIPSITGQKKWIKMRTNLKPVS